MPKLLTKEQVEEENIRGAAWCLTVELTQSFPESGIPVECKPSSLTRKQVHEALLNYTRKVYAMGQQSIKDSDDKTI